MAVYLSIDQDGLSGGIQLCIGDDNGGYRIAGPKYCGQSKTLKKVTLTRRDVEEIRAYLRKVK